MERVACKFSVQILNCQITEVDPKQKGVVSEETSNAECNQIKIEMNVNDKNVNVLNVHRFFFNL